MTAEISLPVPENQPTHYPHTLGELASIVRKDLSAEDRFLITQVEGKNWRRTQLDLSNPADRQFAARGIALGAPVFHGFGNFVALTFHPHQEVMRSVNAAKGRPLEQVASVTTSPEQHSALFDWEKLPEGFDKDRTEALMTKFLDMGPFGFRGPAAAHIPEHLSYEIDGQRTVQLIAPGNDCLSNDLFREALDLSGETFLAITSANVSKTVTGKEEPAHYKMHAIQHEFGNKAPGFVMLAHPDERKVRGLYPLHDPMSTSIIGFYESIPSENGKPVVTIERHGSLPMAQIIEVLDELGFDHKINEKAKNRLPLRKYSVVHEIFSRARESK